MIGEKLPKRSEPGETVTWAVPMERAVKLVYASQAMRDTGNIDDVYVVVELGSGKKRRTGTSLPVRGH